MGQPAYTQGMEAWDFIDTPETDAAVEAEVSNQQRSFVLRDTCKRMERARDKAREDATNYFAKVGELQAELTEARKEVEYYKARYDVLKESW